ncbi:MAG: Glycosyltransferase AglJ [Candidatus Woesearchaeota archaeon]|nr:Glycosyltransferase AglJ [Candidatus Woesearchaeota archaeon]
MDISFIVPVYNEQLSIKETINQIKEQKPNEIIVVDDASTDASYSILKKIKGIKLIQHPYNKGYSSAIKTALRKAKSKYVCIVDADDTYPIKEFPKLKKHINNYDMVVGARSQKNIPLMRKPAKFILKKLANYLANKKIPDLNSGFRIFNKKYAMEFFHLYPQRFSFTVTITLAFLTSGYSVKYVPISYHKRKGKSSIQPKHFVEFINLILRVITYFNPFKIFFTCSILLFLAALGIFGYSNFFLEQVMDITTIIFALSSLQVFLFGLVADMIAKRK